jgi:hypothetical protein
MLGSSEKLTWTAAGEGFVVSIPEKLSKNPPCRDAFVLKFQR